MCHDIYKLAQAHKHTGYRHAPRLNVTSQSEQISSRGELSMEEKRKRVTYASGSAQLLSEFAARFTPLNKGRGGGTPNSTSEELNVAWQQKTLSDVKVNTHTHNAINHFLFSQQKFTASDRHIDHAWKWKCVYSDIHFCCGLSILRLHTHRERPGERRGTHSQFRHLKQAECERTFCAYKSFPWCPTGTTKRFLSLAYAVKKTNKQTRISPVTPLNRTIKISADLSQQYTFELNESGQHWYMLATKQGQHFPPSQPTLDQSEAEQAALSVPRLKTHHTAGTGHA